MSELVDGNLQVKALPAYQPLWTEWDRINTFLLWGGRDSGRSYHSALKIVDECSGSSSKRWVCLRWTQSETDSTQRDQVRTAIHELEHDNEWDATRTSYFTNRRNGSRITFLGLARRKGNRGLVDIDGLFIDEAQDLEDPEFRDFRATALRKMTGCKIILCGNPTNSTDPAWVWSEDLRGEPDVLHIHTTYNDNKYLSDLVKREIQRDNSVLLTNSSGQR